MFCVLGTVINEGGIIKQGLTENTMAIIMQGLYNREYYGYYKAGVI